MNSVSLESWVNGEYDWPFGIARLPVAWPSFIATHYPFLSKLFAQSSISWLVVVVGRQWVAFWKALIVLYRLVVVSRRNTDLLPMDSPKSTPYNPDLKPQSDIPNPNSNPNFQYKDKSNNNKTTIRIVFSSTIQPVYKHCSASLRSPSQNTLNDEQRHHDLLVGRRSQKAPA